MLSAALAVVSLVVLLLWQRRRDLRFALVWSALVLFPTLVVPLIVLVNEHRLYLAGVGGAMVGAWCLVQLARRRRGVALVLAAVYTIIFMALTWQRNQVWADELSLWSDAAAKGPLMLKPQLRLGDALLAQKRYGEAKKAYLRAIELRPQHVAARTNLGFLYKQTGRPRDAEIQFRALLAVSPDAVAARLNLANLLMLHKRWDEAVAEYEKVLEYDDTVGIAWGNLGYIADQIQGDPQTALGHYDRALDLVQSDDLTVRFRGYRGVALRELQRLDEAEADYRNALALDSTYVVGWCDLANLYRDTQRLDLAIGAYKKVIELGADRDLTQRAKQQLQYLKP